VTAKGAPSKKLAVLAEAIRDVLGEAVAAGGSSLRDHRQTDGELGYFQHAFAVYDREGEPCARSTCSGVVGRRVQSGRSTFYCPVCQR
jgi:formamidopyrimidine-DNA glycosylase